MYFYKLNQTTGDGATADTVMQNTHGDYFMLMKMIVGTRDLTTSSLSSTSSVIYLTNASSSAYYKNAFSLLYGGDNSNTSELCTKYNLGFAREFEHVILLSNNDKIKIVTSSANVVCYATGEFVGT